MSENFAGYDLKKLVPKPKTGFKKAKCSSCGNAQFFFTASASKTKCLKCGKPFAKSTASKTMLLGKSKPETKTVEKEKKE